MRKKIWAVWITALCACGIFMTTAYADTSNSVRMVVTDINGERYSYDEVIDPQSLEESGAADIISGYQIYIGGEEILNVKLHDIVSSSVYNEAGTPASNGYYSVKFQLSAEDHTEAFLTGLTPENLNMVQEALIGARLENSEFDMESVDFIDAEKTDLPDDGDDQLCWAASTSDCLHYTGWGQKAGFKDADALFDMFNERFTDFGGNMYLGTEWFFNGTYQMHGKEGSSQLKNPEEYGTKGFLPDYAVDTVRQYVQIDHDHKKIIEVLNALEDGCGVGINVSWVDEDGVRYGGHAITLWGYIIDKDYAKTSHDRYKALIISDSDSDMLPISDRRAAPNKLKVLNIHPYTDAGYDSWMTDGYYNAGVLESASLLKPYSEAVESERDGSKDKFQDPDLAVEDIFASNDANDANYQVKTFSTSDKIYIFTSFLNLGKDFKGSFNYCVTVDGGPTEYNTYNCEIEQYATEQIEEPYAIGPLAVGDYTVTVTVNPSHNDLKEAYYSNNSKTFHFTVKEPSYTPSGVSIEANIGAFVNGMAQAEVSYSGTFPDNAKLTIAQSYYENDKWSAWERAAYDNGEAVGGVSPLMDAETYTVYARGTKIKFRLVIETTEDEPVYNAYSEEYPLLYKKVEITADENNPSELTPVSFGQSQLSEPLNFTVQCVSTDGTYDINCDVAVIAISALTGEALELYQEPVTLDSDHKSKVITFQSWENSGITLSGSYELYAALLQSGYGEVEARLGDLRAEENPGSCFVTTAEDISDPYDGRTSLREAVEHCSNTSTVTFSPEIPICILSEPLEISKPVAIDGSFEYEGGISPQGTAILSLESLFQVKNGAALTLNRLALCGQAEDYGGAVEVVDGSAEIRECRIYNCSSGIAGGGLYAHSGAITLQNCCLAKNESQNGGAIGIGSGALVEMINCTLFQNTSSSGAVYNNGGLTAVFCTLTDNTASSSGGSNVTSPGNANLAGCIAVDDEGISLSGQVRAFGCYLGPQSHCTELRDCETGGKGDIFQLDEDGLAVWTTDDTPERSLHFLPTLKPRAKNGVTVKSRNGYLVYSRADGLEKETGITAAFSDAEYALDALGAKRALCYGSYALAGEGTSYTVTFDSQGGSAVAPVTAAEAAKVSRPADPTRGGYRFGGWYKDRECTTAWNFDTGVVTGNMTLYARWIPDGSGGGSSKPGIKPGERPGTQVESTSPNGPAAGFSDVAASAWYADSVKYVVERGLFGGVGSGRFAPDENMTRAMMWTVLARYKGVNTNTGSHWYEAARAWVMEQNISDGTMADGNVTREQFVTMLWRLSGEPAATAAASFTDSVGVSGYAKTAVDWAVSNGIVNGYNDGSFQPQGSATRAEAAKMLTVYCTLSEG